MPRKNPRRNISRIALRSSRGSSHGGWEVRIQRQGTKHCRFFADRQWGGNRAALKEAKKYRDELEQQLKRYTVKKLAESPSARNTSGVVGVRKTWQTIESNGYEFTYEFWVAQWIDGLGRRKTRSFSIAKYGNEVAYQLALAARRKGVHQAKRTL
jgi:hypothetical protein